MRRLASAVLGLMAIAGCATDRVAPLVPLPDDRMPDRAALAYRPWRVAVVESGGPHVQLERAFTAALKEQLARFGVQTISSDTRANQAINTMLRLQLESGEEAQARDMTYELTQADGVISVTVNSMTVPRRNAQSSWKDKKNKVHYQYTSEVAVSGYYTLGIPKTGAGHTVRFSRTQTQTSYDAPHQFSPEALAVKAARSAATSGSAVQPIYDRFPLLGYVVGAGSHKRGVLVNRGQNQGVLKGRIWEFSLPHVVISPLLGEIESERVLGTGKTIEVYPDSCLVKCESSKVRERAKLGMKARAKGYAFFASVF